MKILITGSNGFIGQNLLWNLKEIRNGKNRTRPGLNITEIYCYDTDSSPSDLDKFCKNCDFVFNLAGVNRPKNNAEFMKGNYDFSSLLLKLLSANHNICPVMLASSSQASLTGRFVNSEYGKSKQAGEELFFNYSAHTGAKTLVYRFPNLFGKWCKPNYNSVVATFCNAIANDLEYTVHDPATELELLYIDDLINGMLDALEGKELHCEYPKDGKNTGLEAVEDKDGRYCYVPATHRVTLGKIIDLLISFKKSSTSFAIPEMPNGSFEKKLYSAYLSYLPQSKVVFDFKPNIDNRGSFTELMQTLNCGQISINVTKPGMTRGEHWHNSKWEIFIVVSGHGLIRERRIGTNPETGEDYPVIEFEVTGKQIKAVQILPGYTHNITNLSKLENLVTLIWANESFDRDYPDTFYEKVL